MKGFLIPLLSEREPHPNPAVRSKSPIFFEVTTYSPPNFPVPIKSLNPILNSGNLSVSSIILIFKLKLLSL